MSLKNLLDLRKKVSPQVQIVERIIFQKRSWKKEALRTFFVVIIATSVIWGVSKADSLPDLSFLSFQEVPPQNFSASGIVSNISNIFGTYISIDNAQSSDSSGKTEYSFNTDTITKIENTDYKHLSLSDIKVGDKIIVQGLLKGSNSIEAYRIISFATSTSEKVEDVASSTPSVETASSTDATSTNPIVPTLVGSSTDMSSTTTDLDTVSTSDTTSTSTPSLIPDFIASSTTSDSPQDTISTISEVVTKVVEKVVETFTGGSDANESASGEAVIQ